MYWVERGIVFISGSLAERGFSGFTSPVTGAAELEDRTLFIAPDGVGYLIASVRQPANIQGAVLRAPTVDDIERAMVSELKLHAI